MDAPHKTRIHLATVVAVALAAFAPAQAVAADASTLDEIYAALRPTNLRTVSGAETFAQGDHVSFAYELENSAATDLVIPLTELWYEGGPRFYTVGIEQAWVERLGANPTIPGLYGGRQGTWYAAGGQLILPWDVVDNTIPAAVSLSRHFSLLPSYTSRFPPGAYRYHIEYKSLGFEVLSRVSVDLNFTGEPIDDVAPALTAPESVTVDATSPDGALVVFDVKATDNADPAPSVVCSSPSGVVYGIGDTVVTCVARDTAGNETTARFLVHVLGADQQLIRLLADVEAAGGDYGLAHKLKAAREHVRFGDVPATCGQIGAFGREAHAHGADSFAARAAQIRRVLSCA